MFASTRVGVKLEEASCCYFRIALRVCVCRRGSGEAMKAPQGQTVDLSPKLAGMTPYQP